MFTVELFIQTLIAGVIIGVLYALMALGITFIYSIVKMINWSMGEFYMIGGYLQYLLIVEWLGADLWWVAAPLSALGVFLLGYLLEPLLIKPMFTTAVERKDDYAIVVTIALLLMLRNLAAALGGPYQRTPGSNLPTVMLGPLPESGARLPPFCARLPRSRCSIYCSRRLGSVWRCARRRRAASARRPPASTCSASTRSPLASASALPGSPAPCSRPCSWCFRRAASSPR